MPKKIHLRGHHFLCILTYQGVGYTPGFVTNFDIIVAAINQGAEIEVVAGIDDICGALRQGVQITCEHAKTCRSDEIKFRDRRALNDIARVLQMPYMKQGDKLQLKKGEILYLRQYFLRGAIRRGCMACSWHPFCTKIAQSGFKEVKLLPAAVPR